MNILDTLTSLLAPHCCVRCGTEGSIICNACACEAVLLPAASCYRCGRPTPGHWHCLECQASSPLRRLWVRSAYTDTPKQLVHDYKFSHARGISRTLAKLMSEALPPLPSGTVITYVPTAPKRIRERGYDQAGLLARRLAERLGLPSAALLARAGKQRQVGADRATRLRQLEHAFRPSKTYLIRDASILLIDDVITTGASLEAAAWQLRAAGAARVDAAVFAQAQ